MGKRCRRYRGALIGGAGPRFRGTPQLFTGEGYLHLSDSTMAMIAAMAAKGTLSGMPVTKARQEILGRLVLDGRRAAKALPPGRQDQLLEELAAFGNRCRIRKKGKEKSWNWESCLETPEP
jgi:hypothetical protein